MDKIALKRSFSMLGLKLKKNAPIIATVLGTIGVAGGTYLACKATYKLKDTVDVGKEKIEDIEAEREEVLACDDLNEEEREAAEKHYKKEITIQTCKNALEVAKLYSIPAAVQTVSVGLLVGSNITMQKRMSSLAAAYATIDAMYRKYRKNVREAFGEDVDNEMRHGIKHTKIEEVLVDEDGKEHVVATNCKVVDENDPNSYGDYARFFDSSCPSYDDCAEYNMLFLKAIQAHCNDLLKSRGYLFLNEVYEAIGLEKSIAGQSVGWIYDEKNPVGDNYVDFGLFRNNDITRRFVNGYEPVILLDFNVDGDILHNPKLRLWK